MNAQRHPTRDRDSCACRPPWPSLIAVIDGAEIPAYPSGTPGPVCALYWA
jgi:hypothetical protein